MTSSLRWFACAALLAAPVFGASTARFERVLEKTFSVAGVGTLEIETQGGEIRVSPSTDSTVKVTAKQRIRASNEAEADEFLKKLELTMEQTGNDVLLRSKYEKRASSFFKGSWPPVQVDFIVTVPASFATKLSTSGGTINLGDLNGEIFARTSGGSIKIGQAGNKVDAHTSGGSITLSRAGGPVVLKTSGGSIKVGEVAGSAELATSGGGIEVDSVSGALRANTSGGSIRAIIAGGLKEDCVLSTSGGGVRVAVDKAAAFQLDASTSGGSVRAEGLTMTLNGSAGRSSLAGQVNGGGPLLKLRTSGGSITVAAR